MAAYSLVRAVAFGLLLSPIGLLIEHWSSGREDLWDDTRAGDWPPGFYVATVPSSLDGVDQESMVYIPRDAIDPQVVLLSLHSWSGRYNQFDPLARVAKEKGWAYIRPDVRGANNHPDACLSDKVISDVDDALSYIKSKVRGPRSPQVHVVGVSGGGYTALGVYARSRHQLNSVQAWVPISSLTHWYSESLAAQRSYADDIAACTGSGRGLNLREMENRSPINWLTKPRSGATLRLYAGVKDGHTGSVPITHSIDYFNRFVKLSGRQESQISQDDRRQLLAAGSGLGEQRKSVGLIADRSILYQKVTPEVSITIFDGGHELLPPAAIEQLDSDIASANR